MNAIDFIESISKTSLPQSNLRYCLVTDQKRPIKFDGTPARPNCVDDFVEFEMLFQNTSLEDYAGIGISIQASQICAIDVDKCFSKSFDVNSADERAIDILSKFSKYSYCEFSFSGTGLRILFKHDIIDHYSDQYYIKNESNKIEYYQPSKSFRYVTITGKTISNLPIQICPTQIVEEFLDDYMKKPEQKTYSSQTSNVEDRSLKELQILVKRLYLKDVEFQNLWFGQAPGSGKNESELDYKLLAILFEKITQDKNFLRVLFESSNYFKSKDWKHVCKWNNGDHRYFNYIYERIQRTHI